MKKIFFVLLLISPVFYFSCKSGGGDPKTVATHFFEALHKKDIPAARKLATEDSKSMLDIMETSLKMNNISEEDTKFDPKGMEIGDAVIDGDNATVPIKKISSEVIKTFKLKKESGDWKIEFTQAALMGDVLDKMKESGINIADSIGKAMKELKNVNMDSLKQEMKKKF